MPAGVLLLPLLLMRLVADEDNEEDVVAVLGPSLPSVSMMTGWFVSAPPDERGPLEEMGAMEEDVTPTLPEAALLVTVEEAMDDE